MVGFAMDGHKFYGHAEWIVNFIKRDQIYDSHLRIKVMAL